MAAELQITVAARLYEVRATLRRLLGDRYAAVLEPYQLMLQKVQERQGGNFIEAATWVANRVDRTDGTEIMKIFAAAVELIEPSSPPQHDGEPK